MPRISAFALAFVAIASFTLPASAAAASAAPAIAAPRGLRVEQTSRDGDELVVRLRSDADLSAVATVAVLVATGSDGQRVELARAPLARHVFDRTPRRRARLATVRFAVPEGASGALRVELASGL